MSYTKDDILTYIKEEDVKFIRLAFCDIYGKSKNISVMPDELENVFEYGYTVSSDGIEGFDNEKIVLWPDTNTISVLPWRPSHGRVVRMFCDVKKQNGESYESSRKVLKDAILYIKDKADALELKMDIDFYLFKLDEEGNATGIPYDGAGNMDIAPLDKGENVRREICLSLYEMGIKTRGSYHGRGPGQNRICLEPAGALVAAENALTTMNVVRTIAARNGLYADFTSSPIQNKPINKNEIAIKIEDGSESCESIKKHFNEFLLFINKDEKYTYDVEKNISYDSYLNEIHIGNLSAGYNMYIIFALLLYAIGRKDEDDIVGKFIPKSIIDKYTL